MYDPLSVYRGRYKEFIESIRGERPLNETFENSADHHIIPRCTFEDKNDPRIDDKDNHINLTYREHFIAHKILTEENPDNHKLFYAYWRMCNGKTKIATPEEYESARVAYSNRQRGENNPACRPDIGKKISESKKNPPLSTRIKISRARVGKSHPRTEESKKKISEGLKGNTNNRGKHWKINPNLPKRAHPTEYKVTCRLCGLEFIGTSANSKYCEDCKK